MYKLDKNVPLTEANVGRGRKVKYPFRSMEVGDSFFVPAARTDRARVQKVVSNCARQATKEWKFATRQVVGGVRVHRVA